MYGRLSLKIKKIDTKKTTKRIEKSDETWFIHTVKDYYAVYDFPVYVSLKEFPDFLFKGILIYSVISKGKNKGQVEFEGVRALPSDEIPSDLTTLYFFNKDKMSDFAFIYSGFTIPDIELSYKALQVRERIKKRNSKTQLSTCYTFVIKPSITLNKLYVDKLRMDFVIAEDFIEFDINNLRLNHLSYTGVVFEESGANNDDYYIETNRFFNNLSI